MEKRRVEEEIYVSEFSWARCFSGSINEVIQNLKELKKSALEQYPQYYDIKLKTRLFYEDYDVEVKGLRMETDAEVDVRRRKAAGAKKAADKRKENKRKREQQEYERLKAKFEK